MSVCRASIYSYIRISASVVWDWIDAGGKLTRELLKDHSTNLLFLNRRQISLQNDAFVNVLKRNKAKSRKKRQTDKAFVQSYLWS